MACNGLGVTAILVAGNLAVLNPGAPTEGNPPFDAAATAAIAAAFLTAFAAATARPRCIAAPLSAAAAADKYKISHTRGIIRKMITFWFYYYNNYYFYYLYIYFF